MFTIQCNIVSSSSQSTQCTQHSLPSLLPLSPSKFSSNSLLRCYALDSHNFLYCMVCMYVVCEQIKNSFPFKIFFPTV
ncbi:hypothetical protein BT96DRAFT_460442 [Gymnopus androsaceus JB14]|uniref:Uncharacterized protein n=1 Tax=Gymnopus androsaceus JB14 TaxID=1447944 RepID=A0A6A4IIW8_9AGAR|nr:hypothetical protein BT96DRAFT_460442 [Gymnopus androsaceus JB14]